MVDPLRKIEEEVATTCPAALVERMLPGMLRVRSEVEAEVEKRFVAVKAVEEALAKVVLPVKELTPEKVLELARSVVEATEMEDPAAKETPLMVPRVPAR
jgi:hypothetical protein